MNHGYIPIATSQSGSCLTMANWQEIGINALAFQLQSLLMKPGFSLLRSFANLQSYCAWSKGLILNASLPLANAEGVHKFRSLYDGTMLTISQPELFALIIKLEADIVILPEGFIGYLAEQPISFPSSVKLFVPEKDFLTAKKMNDFGISLVYDSTKSFDDFYNQFKQYSCPTYLSGLFTLIQAKKLMEGGASYLESNLPSNDALRGQIYDEDSSFNLLDSEMAHQHKLISSNCTCPTCTQKLTRAYLHHLYLHTPLLCHRFLIHHNAHYYKGRIETKA
ncbi:MAG: hypothetical protein H0U70_05005 [Tatlockia sp.]|nr:hypothetical protein [Tatlockia sp.]